MTEQYHFIGIGGIGMSGLARMLIQQNIQVTGSDINQSYVTDYLGTIGAKVSIGHSKEHVSPNTTVVYSTDIAQDNPELKRAQELSCPLWHRSDLLVHLMKSYKTVLVTGTHGKTTTSALLSHVFAAANRNPHFAVGGMMHGLQCNASFGTGELFIAEADESDATFLKYPYAAAIVTNIDTDHLAHYGNWNALVEAFTTFMAKSEDPETLFYCCDDEVLKGLSIKGTSYGFSEEAVFRGKNFRQEGFRIFYDIEYGGITYSDVEVSLTGLHNARNSLAVFAFGLRYGLTEEELRHGLSTFSGVKRRLEKKGEVQNAVLFDDYAHHPTEIQATLQALRLAVGAKRIIAVFQPHRYSRMRFLLKNFTEAFDAADVVLVTDLFTAREKAVSGISSEAIFHEIKRHYPKNCYFIPREVLTEAIYEMLLPGDVVVTLGAADITQVGAELCKMG